jgi:hypothetical protein
MLMPRPLRLALVVLGPVVAVYGASTLTGSWLGTPPWWTATVVPVDPSSAPDTHFLAINLRTAPRPGYEWISGAVIAVGVGLVAWGGWPRRRAHVATRV